MQLECRQALVGGQSCPVTGMGLVGVVAAGVLA